MSETNQITEVVEESTESGESKTFTQDEVNALIESRLARAKKQMPAREELEEFKNWKESQKTEAERQAQREKEFHETMSERDAIKRENTVLRAGVDFEHADYVLFKVSKLEGEFEENLKQFLTDNPKYLKNTVVVDEKPTGITAPHQSLKQEELGFLKYIKQKNPDFKGVG